MIQSRGVEDGDIRNQAKGQGWGEWENRWLHEVKEGRFGDCSVLSSTTSSSIVAGESDEKFSWSSPAPSLSWLPWSALPEHPLELTLLWGTQIPFMVIPSLTPLRPHQTLSTLKAGKHLRAGSSVPKTEPGTSQALINTSDEWIKAETEKESRKVNGPKA